jgi:chromosome segregation ATPase
MATKRVAASPKRASKKSRTTKLIPVVVDALDVPDVLPADLRSVLATTLPVILDTNKEDRHAYQSEVVQETEKSLSAVLAALEVSHAEALKKQDEMIAPAEHKKRTSVKKEADDALAAAQAKLEASKTSLHTCRESVKDAQKSLAASEKEVTAAEKDFKKISASKDQLSELLGELETHTTKGLKKLEAFGKEMKLDGTLLQALPFACKKAPSDRSDFDKLVCTDVKSKIDGEIVSVDKSVAEAEATKAGKAAQVEACKEKVTAAQTAVTAAEEANTAAQGAVKEAEKEVKKADDSLNNIWADMKEVCDAQDGVKADIKTFKEEVLMAFETLKNKEPEPEPVVEPEPVAEAAEPVAEVEAAAPVAVAEASAA